VVGDPGNHKNLGGDEKRVVIKKIDQPEILNKADLGG